MEKLNIDAAAVAREALQQRQAGEDLDEALLRACKKLYGESAMLAFQALQSAFGAVAGQLKLDRAAALERIADGASGIRVSTTIRTTQKTTTKSIDELSPEANSKVEQALAAGKTSIVVNRSSAPPQVAMQHCGGCGFEFPAELATCPKCGAPVKRSFWGKLFGK